MTDEQIKRDRETIAAATRGPWSAGVVGGIVHYRRENFDCAEIANTLASPHALANAAFIADARTRWPAALDEIERTRGFVADARRFFVAESVARKSAEEALTKAFAEIARLRAVLVQAHQVVKDECPADEPILVDIVRALGEVRP